MNFPFFSLNQLAVLSKKDRRTVSQKLVGLKFQMEGKSKLYDAREALPLIIGTSADSKSIEKQIQEEELRERKARADKIELEVALRRGQQVPIEDVIQDVAKEYTRVRASIRAISSKLAHPLAMVNDPAKVKEILDEAHSEALEHLTKDAEDELKQYGSELTDSPASDSDVDSEGTASSESSGMG